MVRKRLYSLIPFGFVFVFVIFHLCLILWVDSKLIYVDIPVKYEQQKVSRASDNVVNVGFRKVNIRRRKGIRKVELSFFDTEGQFYAREYSGYMLRSRANKKYDQLKDQQPVTVSVFADPGVEAKKIKKESGDPRQKKSIPQKISYFYLCEGDTKTFLYYMDIANHLKGASCLFLMLSLFLFAPFSEKIENDLVLSLGLGAIMLYIAALIFLI